MKRNFLAMLVMPLAFAFSARANDLPPIRLSLDSAPMATGLTLSYEAQCPAGKYRIKMSRDSQRVEFEFDGTFRHVADLSATPFGAAFRVKGLYGDFSYTCPKVGLRIYFYGFDVRESGQPRPIFYKLTISNGGEIVYDQGILDERLGVVVRTLNADKPESEEEAEIKK